MEANKGVFGEVSIETRIKQKSNGTPVIDILIRSRNMGEEKKKASHHVFCDHFVQDNVPSHDWEWKKRESDNRRDGRGKRRRRRK